MTYPTTVPPAPSLGVNKVEPNILNAEEIKTWAQNFSQNYSSDARLQSWINTTFAKWLRTQETGLLFQCVNKRQALHPLMPIICNCTTEEYSLRFKHLRLVDTADLPVWARKALRDNNLWFWNVPEDSSVYEHWMDFLLQKEVTRKQLTMTVPQLQKQVAAWDLRLQKDVYVANLDAGTKLVESMVLEGLSDKNLVLVELQTKSSFKKEGQVMKHCVGTYWGRANTRIFSLRNTSEIQPLATVEVRTPAPGDSRTLPPMVVQVQGPKDEFIGNELTVLLFKVMVELGFLWSKNVKGSRDLPNHPSLQYPATKRYRCVGDHDDDGEGDDEEYDDEEYDDEEYDDEDREEDGEEDTF